MWGHLCPSDTFHFLRPVPKWQLNPRWPPTALRTPSDIAGQSGRTGLRRTFGGTSPLWLRLCQCPLVKHRTMIEFRVKHRPIPKWQLNPWWPPTALRTPSDIAGQSGRTGLRRTFGGTSPLWLRLCQCPLVKHRTMIEFRVKAELGKLYRLTFPWWGREGRRLEVGGRGSTAAASWHLYSELATLLIHGLHFPAVCLPKANWMA